MAAIKQQIADFIDSFWAENWTSPTVRELQHHVHHRNPSSVHRWLGIMVDEGTLERKRVGARVLYRTRR